jgi:hypothetical protein
MFTSIAVLFKVIRTDLEEKIVQHIVKLGFRLDLTVTDGRNGPKLLWWCL